jgi:hypothetical protein
MMLLIRFLLLLIVLPLNGLLDQKKIENGPTKPKSELVSLHFDAISDGKKVIVNWTTEGEQTSDYFTVEKSKDGIHFYTALMIKSAGNLTNVFEYTDIDYSPFSGISYYRLRQNNYFGEFSYSSISVVNCQLSKDGTIAPASSNKLSAAELKELEGKSVLVVVRDNKGTEFICKLMISSQNETVFASDAKNQLIPGDYFVVASSCNPLYHQKLIVK